MPFIVKKYDIKEGLTKRLFSCFVERRDIQKRVIIEGPMGQGLNISPLKAGTVVIIAGGTGILPFLDFFYYLLW